MKTQSDYHRAHVAGFSLVEVVIAVSILMIVLAATYTAMQSTLLGTQCTALHGTLDSKTAAILDLMTQELKDGGTKYSNFSISSTQQSITFARSTGCASGKPIFGNQITYAFVTYGTSSCLERTEVIGGVDQKEVLTDKLASTPLAMTTTQGTTFNVTGVNFQILSADVVTISIVIQQDNTMLTENTNITDNTMVVTAQVSVQMSND